uniref:Uncharacterized protein n=1 Tax=Knipowitschia caucasica TaxID=637954 RepID=A0AAV2J4V0_KNICA
MCSADRVESVGSAVSRPSIRSEQLFLHTHNGQEAPLIAPALLRLLLRPARCGKLPRRHEERSAASPFIMCLQSSTVAALCDLPSPISSLQIHLKLRADVSAVKASFSCCKSNHQLWSPISAQSAMG